MPAFISYSRANSDFAVRLAKDLKSSGYNVWLDQLDIPTGTRWDDEIELALEACTTFIIILSPESLKSQNVKDEVGYAIDAGKDILPVLIKSGDVPFRLRRFQYVDFTNKPYDASLKEIKSLLAPEGHLVDSQTVEKNPIDGESDRPTKKVKAIGGASSAKPEAIPSPSAKRKAPAGLLIGIIAVVVVLIAVGVVAASRMSRPSEATLADEVSAAEILPTEQPTASPTPDTTPAEEVQPETFLTKFMENTDLNEWEHLVKGVGSRKKVEIKPSSDGLVFHLEDQDLYTYYMYNPAIYADVIIRMKAENLGQNHNYVSLVCRRTGDQWYEFSVTGGGDWHLYNHSAEYKGITNGGTFAIKYGKTINEYEMRCIGNDISLLINGQLVETVDVTPYRNNYTEGQVGFGVSAREVYPIDIKVIEFEVSKP